VRRPFAKRSRGQTYGLCRPRRSLPDASLRAPSLHPPADGRLQFNPRLSKRIIFHTDPSPSWRDPGFFIDCFHNRDGQFELIAGSVDDFRIQDRALKAPRISVRHQNGVTPTAKLYPAARAVRIVSGASGRFCSFRRPATALLSLEDFRAKRVPVRGKNAARYDSGFERRFEFNPNRRCSRRFRLSVPGCGRRGAGRRRGDGTGLGWRSYFSRSRQA
jgi:hypothetical protein